MTVQEHPNYYVAANFRYKYQAVKASHLVSKRLPGDSKLRVFLLHNPLHGWYQLSNWFVAIFGPLPALDMDASLKDALRAAKGELVQFDDVQLHELQQAYLPESR